MKLRNIYMICRDNREAINNLEGKDTTMGGRPCIRVTGWKGTLEALMRTREAASLRVESNAIIDAVPELFRTKDSFTVQTQEWNAISEAQEQLLRTIADTMDLYEKMGMDTENRVGIDIKLPPFHDFTEFVEYLKDLQFVLTKCPFLQSEEETLQFENVDVGSTWLTFLVIGGAMLTGGSILMNNFAAFIDKCFIIKSHYLTTEKQKLDLEHSQQSSEEKKVIFSYLDTLFQKEIDAATQELEEISGHKVQNTDGDEPGRIKECFKRMGDLLDKGMQIYAAIDTPDETKRLFEPLEMKYLEISKAQELLEDKTEK